MLYQLLSLIIVCMTHPIHQQYYLSGSSKNAWNQNRFIYTFIAGLPKKWYDTFATLNDLKQKSHRKRWLNYMILKLKIGGPCWV